MVPRQYSDSVFKKEAPLFIATFLANKTYKAACQSVLIVTRGYLEIAIKKDKIRELETIANLLISRINTHACNLRSIEIILNDLMNESVNSDDHDVLCLRGEIRKLLSQPM